jgi:hypothetical protein
MCCRMSNALRPSAKHTDLELMHRRQHALAPPLGHTPTLTSASALRHYWLSSHQSRHATCWQTWAWMTVGCLDAHAPEEATTTAHGARS